MDGRWTYENVYVSSVCMLKAQRKDLVINSLTYKLIYMY